MSEFLKKDTTIKILSVLFAVILWFVVNPIDSTSVSIPLTVRGEDTLKDKSLMLKNKDYTRTIEVVVRGNKEKIKNISGYEFEAILDFSKIDSADDQFLSIEGPKYIGKEDGIVIHKVLQDSIKVDLERLEKTSFPIEIKQTGTLKNGYKIINITPIPESVTLEESERIIKTVGEIRTVISVNNIDRDTVLKKQQCKVYDEDGREMSALSKNLTIDVKVQVAKEVPVSVVLKGKPASDFTDSTRSVNPEKVLITGPAEILAKIGELKTQPVSVEKLNKSVETVSMIVLPSGVKLVDIPREVSVSVLIEPLSRKTFTISKDSISLANGTADTLSYNIKTESIDVGIKAPKNILNSINIADTKPSIDVLGLAEGVHKVPLSVSLPEESRLDKEYLVEIEILKIATPE